MKLQGVDLLTQELLMTVRRIYVLFFLLLKKNVFVSLIRGIGDKVLIQYQVIR